MKVDLKKLIISLCVVFIVSLISAIIIKDYTKVYNSLVLPSLAVDKSVFGIVWPILYFLMGISLYLVVKLDDPNKTSAIIFFILQLLFNFFWPILFFLFENYLLSLVWLIMLIVLIAITMYKFYKINKLSFILLVPYFLWCLFALYLNYNIYLLN